MPALKDLYPYKIAIPENIPEDRHEDILTWLMESVNEDDWDVGKEDNCQYIYFSNDVDAVAFKVVWFPDDDEV